MSGGIPEHQDHRPVEEASVDATIPAESDASTTTANEAPDNVDGTKDDNSVRDHESSSEVAKGLSTMLSSVIRDFDSRAEDTIRSQDQLCFALNRLNGELDQLLDDAPLPFIMQHAVRISGVRKRVSSLNTVLKSIQWRLDNIDCMLSMGLAHERAAGERQDNIITSQN